MGRYEVLIFDEQEAGLPERLGRFARCNEGGCTEANPYAVSSSICPAMIKPEREVGNPELTSYASMLSGRAAQLAASLLVLDCLLREKEARKIFHARAK